MEKVDIFKEYIIYDNMISGRRVDGSFGINELFDSIKDYYGKSGVIGISIIGARVDENDLKKNVIEFPGKGYALKAKELKTVKEIKSIKQRNHILPIRLVIDLLTETLEIERKELLINKILPYHINDENFYKNIKELKEEENYVINYVNGIIKNNAKKGTGFSVPLGKLEKMNSNSFLIYLGDDKIKQLKTRCVNEYQEIDIPTLIGSLKPDLKEKVNKKLSNKEIYDKFISILNLHSDFTNFKNFKYKVNGGEFLISFDLNPKERITVGTNFMYREVLINRGNSVNKTLLYNLSKDNTIEEAVKCLERYNIHLFDFITTLIDGRKNPLNLYKK